MDADVLIDTADALNFPFHDCFNAVRKDEVDLTVHPKKISLIRIIVILSIAVYTLVTLYRLAQEKIRPKTANSVASNILRLNYTS